MTKPPALICDLDGTLCELNGRDPYRGDLCQTDTVNEPVIRLVCAMRDAGWKIVYLSGRPALARQATMTWLLRAGAIRPGDLLMLRADDDWRPSEVYKWEVYERVIAPRVDVRLALDDHGPTVQMWRALGIPCWQVADTEHKRPTRAIPGQRLPTMTERGDGDGDVPGGGDRARRGSPANAVVPVAGGGDGGGLPRLHPAPGRPGQWPAAPPLGRRRDP